jgi:hypothetical protein
VPLWQLLSPRSRRRPRTLPLRDQHDPDPGNAGADHSVYVLIAIVRKRLALEASLYTLLQVISVTVFEKIAIQSALSGAADKSDSDMNHSKLNLWGNLPDTNDVSFDERLRALDRFTNRAIELFCGAAVPAEIGMGKSRRLRAEDDAPGYSGPSCYTNRQKG